MPPSWTPLPQSGAGGGGARRLRALLQPGVGGLRVALISRHPLTDSLLLAAHLLRDVSATFLTAAGRTDSCMGAGVLAVVALCLPVVTERSSGAPTCPV